MTLSGYVPDLIEEDFNKLLANALKNASVIKKIFPIGVFIPEVKEFFPPIEKSIDIKE